MRAREKAKVAFMKGESDELVANLVLLKHKRAKTSMCTLRGKNGVDFHTKAFMKMK